MKKRLLAMLLALTMVMALLAGCGSPAASSASSADASEVQSAPAPVEEQPSQAPTAPEVAESVVESTVEVSAVEPEVPQVEYPLTDQEVTFELWYPFPGDLSDIMDEYLGQGKNSVLQAAKETTGVSLSFILQSVNAATDNFNLMVASGDYPDLIFNPSSYYTGGMDKAVSDEVLLDLSGMVEEYAPNYYRLVTQDETTLGEAPAAWAVQAGAGPH